MIKNSAIEVYFVTILALVLVLVSLIAEAYSFLVTDLLSPSVHYSNLWSKLEAEDCSSSNFTSCFNGLISLDPIQNYHVSKYDAYPIYIKVLFLSSGVLLPIVFVLGIGFVLNLKCISYRVYQVLGLVMTINVSKCYTLILLYSMIYIRSYKLKGFIESLSGHRTFVEDRFDGTYWILYISAACSFISSLALFYRPHVQIDRLSTSTDEPSSNSEN